MTKKINSPINGLVFITMLVLSVIFSTHHVSASEIQLETDVEAIYEIEVNSNDLEIKESISSEQTTSRIPDCPDHVGPEVVTAPEDEVEVENTTPAEASAPAEESTPVEESSTADGVTVSEGGSEVENTTPAEESAAAEESTPTEESSTAEGVTAPEYGVEVEKTTPVEESAPAEDATPVEQFSTAEGVTAPKDGVEVENTTPVEASAPAEESTPVEESLTAKDVTLLDDPTATEDVTSIPFNRQRANLAQPQDNPKAVSGLSVTSQIGQVKIKWQPSPDADGYIIKRRTGENGVPVVISTTSDTYVYDVPSQGVLNYYGVFPYRLSNGRKIIGPCPHFLRGMNRSLQPLKEIRSKSEQERVIVSWDSVPGARYYGVGKLTPVLHEMDKKHYSYLGSTNREYWIDRQPSQFDFSYYFVFPFTYNVNHETVKAPSPKYTYGKSANGICVRYENHITDKYVTHYVSDSQRLYTSPDQILLPGKNTVYRQKYAVIGGKKHIFAQTFVSKRQDARVSRGTLYEEKTITPYTKVEVLDSRVWDYIKKIQQKGRDGVVVKTRAGTLNSDGRLVTNNTDPIIETYCKVKSQPEIHLIGGKTPKYIEKDFYGEIPFESKYIAVTDATKPIGYKSVVKNGIPGKTKYRYRIPIDPYTGKQVKEYYMPERVGDVNIVSQPIDQIIGVNNVQIKRSQYKTDPIYKQDSRRWRNYRHVTKTGKNGVRQTNIVYDVNPQTGALINRKAGAVIIKSAVPAEITVGTYGYMAIEEEQKFLNLVNAHRKAHGRQPVRYLQDLAELARVRCRDIVDEFDHVPIGTPRYPIDCENLAYNSAIYGTAEGAFEMWRNSPGHNANMLDKNLKFIGFSMLIDDTKPYKRMYTAFVGRYNANYDF
ncbi:MAG: hypothetical protein GX239_05050, partial [Clostridiaceae bacterium]|nr:hypothetical protein [Clostridiaceae bacterium]